MWRWPTTGRFLEYMKITYGWSLMLVVVFCVLYFPLSRRPTTAAQLMESTRHGWDEAARERRLSPPAGRAR